jgi:hypothetical protein
MIVALRGVYGNVWQIDVLAFAPAIRPIRNMSKQKFIPPSLSPREAGPFHKLHSTHRNPAQTPSNADFDTFLPFVRSQMPEI